MTFSVHHDIPILLLDGGLGTTLSSPPYNINYDSSTPTWSSHLVTSSPSTLAAVHRDFIRAGADIISTATYQASVEGFVQTLRPTTERRSSNFQPSVGGLYHGDKSSRRTYSPSEAEEIMRSALSLTISCLSPVHLPSSPLSVFPSTPLPLSQTALHRPAAALSLGPYGATLIPSTDYLGLSSYPPYMQTVAALEDWHYKRLHIYASAPAQDWDRIEYIAFETIRAPKEACAIRRAVDRLRYENALGDGKRVWVSTVVPEDIEEGQRGDGSQARSGQGWEARVREWTRAMLVREKGSARVWGVGVNCSAVEKMEKVVEVMGEVMSQVRGQFMRERAGNEEELVGDEYCWLVLYPDGTRGETYDPERKEWVGGAQGAGRMKAADWAEQVTRIVARAKDSGMWKGLVVGGCCKTGPQEIGELRKQLLAELDS